MNLKKILLSSFIIISPSFVLAEVTWDLVNNTIYSTPMTPDINQAEWLRLFGCCVKIEQSMKEINEDVDSYQTIKQMIFFLNGIGSLTAKRLIADLEKNTVMYPDGTVLTYLDGTFFGCFA